MSVSIQAIGVKYLFRGNIYKLGYSMSSLMQQVMYIYSIPE